MILQQHAPGDLQEHDPMTGKPTPTTENMVRGSKVEAIERNGFKAVVFRLHGTGSGYGVDQEMRDLARSHRPKLDPDGTVSHFLLFDLEDVKNMTDPLVGLFLAGVGNNVSGLVPAVGLLDLTLAHQAVIEMVRLDRLLPVFADEQAAFDAMTPCGFPSAISLIGDKSARRQADLAEAAMRRVQRVPDASPPLITPNVGHGEGPVLQPVQTPLTSDLAQKPPSVKQGTDEGSPLTEAFVPATDPKQKLGIQQRAIFAAEWAAGVAIGTVLCPFVSPVFALFLTFHILEGMRMLPLVLKVPLGVVLTIVLIPVMLIPAWVICAVFGHEMVSTPACRACGGKVFKDVQFITDQAVIAEMVDRELKIGEVVCANCGKNFRDICA